MPNQEILAEFHAECGPSSRAVPGGRPCSRHQNGLAPPAARLPHLAHREVIERAGDFRLLGDNRKCPTRIPNDADYWFGSRAPSYSITSSARASTVAGTSRPSALAVLRLSTVSYLRHILTVGESELFQALAECVETASHRVRRSAVEKADRRNCRLLCPDRQRSRCRRGAEQCHEFATSHRVAEAQDHAKMPRSTLPIETGNCD
jgi:hypothetical protein